LIVVDLSPQVIGADGPGTPEDHKPLARETGVTYRKHEK